MNKKIWIVNDKLTCIKGRETFWHELLGLSPNIKDKTSPFKSFKCLEKYISLMLIITPFFWRPKYIIRNCTFFPPFPWIPKTMKLQNENVINNNKKSGIISILQDFYSVEHFKKEIIPVIEQSTWVVCVSPFMLETAKNILIDESMSKKLILINNGVDENFFKSTIKKKENNPKVICFIGANNYFKNLPLLNKIITNTGYQFKLIMRDLDNKFAFEHERVTVYKNQDAEQIKNIISTCDIAICTSTEKETFHLSGIEMMMMNLPIATTYVGIYRTFAKNNNKIHTWGCYINEKNAITQLKKIAKSVDVKKFYPRDFVISRDLSKSINNNLWKKLLEIN